MIELLGTAASVIVALSLTMKNIKTLRIVNTVGALLFSGYGLLIASWPVFGLNLFIAGTNLYYLRKMFREHTTFALVPIRSTADPHLKMFLEHYGKDIKRFHPDFSLSARRSDRRQYFILRETLPIALFIYERDPEKEWEIILDYAVPSFRDFQNARFLFKEGWKKLDLQGENRLVTFSRVKTHQRYLEKLGFQKILTVGELEKYAIELR